MRYYIIAGEASGDLHASNLVSEIKKKDNKAEFRGCGGDKMKTQGVDLLKHYRTMAYMGFVEVAVNLRKVLRNIAQTKKDIMEYLWAKIVELLLKLNIFLIVLICWSFCRLRRSFTDAMELM